jgi:hypothetical protein
VFRAALRIARPVALLVASVSLVACVASAGAVSPSGSPTPTPKPVDADTPIFRVSWDGGFVTPDMLLGRLPMIVVYADGRVVTQGPQILIYPGPLMPNLVERTLSQAALDRLIELAREKNLLRTIHYDFPSIADAADTVLEITLEGATHRVSAYALAEAIDLEIPSGDVVLDPAAIEGRAALREFIDALSTIPESDFVDQEHPFVMTSLRLYAGVAAIVEDSEFPGEQPPVAWPLGDLATAGEPLANSPIEVRCQVIEGDDLATLLPILQDANSLSVFESEGEFYSLIPRPLLPGETGC